MQIKPIKNFFYDAEVPADKSITHRALVLSSLAHGANEIKNPLLTKDTYYTITALQKLGIDIQVYDDVISISDKKRFNDAEIDLGTSATAVSLLCGALSTRFINAKIVGDDSLFSRPINRILTPLQIMGANISLTKDTFPIRVQPALLKGIRYDMILDSSQVKSAILTAAISASSELTLNERNVTKNHTELMLKHLGADIKISGKTIKINPSELEAKEIFVPGDISMASYIFAFGMLCGKGGVRVKNLGVNPTRNKVLEVLKKFGAKVKIENPYIRNGEPVADVIVKPNDLVGIRLDKTETSQLVDELPLIMTLACFVNGETVIEISNSDFEKGSNKRISILQQALTKMGADIIANDTSCTIYGKPQLAGGVTVDSFGDYRVAMSLAIAGAASKNGCYINDFDCVEEVYRDFKDLLV